jgi:PPOX class probable F420-dependent enzyme
MRDPVDDGRERRREFVRAHRTAVFGYQRKSDGPSMSIVYYVMDGDEQILVSTMRDRAKAKAIERDPRVALCVLDEQWPPSYLQVYCSASVDTDFDGAVGLMLRVSELMAGHSMPDSARSDLEAMVRAESRVVLTLKPYATFQTPPRHVSQASDIKDITHWTSESLPW